MPYRNWRLFSVELAANPLERIVTASVSFPAQPRRPDESEDERTARRFAAMTPRVDALLERLQAMPEFESVAFVDVVPLSGRNNTSSGVDVVGRPWPGGSERPQTEWRFVSADYFRTMGLQLLRGRAFAPEDSHGPGITTEVLVNDAFVRTFLDGVDPIGQQLAFYDPNPKTIVGVVESARQWGLAAEPSPEVYLPIYDAYPTDLDVVARTRGAPALALEPLRKVLRDAVPDYPVTALRTMEDIVRGVETMRRFFSTLMIAFSTVALALATVGLYGLVAYSVAQRRVELGVRMSLGADRSRVLSMILRQGLVLVLLGLVVGVLGSLALSNVLAAQLYGVSPRDPWVLAAVALVLLLVGALASAVPALRAAAIAPVEALRHT